MILTPRFTFIHLHKSGGTFVNEVLLKYVPGARQIGHHLRTPGATRKLDTACLPPDVLLGVARVPGGGTRAGGGGTFRIHVLTCIEGVHCSGIGS
jgi:hypothetical protein